MIQSSTQEDIPDGWTNFTAALPPNLYARLVARAEREGAGVLIESAYLLAYALDKAPRPSESWIEETGQKQIEALESRISAERAAALRPRLVVAARAVGRKHVAKKKSDA